MSSYGVRISAPNVDVKTGADKDMVLTTKYSVLKGSVSDNGVINLPQDGLEHVVSVPHGLDFIPMATGFWNDRDGDVFDPAYWYPLPTYIFGFGATDFLFTIDADATNINLRFLADDSGAGEPNIDIAYNYYFFVDKANLN